MSKNLKINCNWLNLNVDLNKSTFISVDKLIKNKDYERNILLLIEPPGVSNIYENSIKNHKDWDYIISWNDKFLNFSNSIFFQFGVTWIPKDKEKINKDNLCSIICGDKNWMPGHKKRKEVYLSSIIEKKIKKFFSKNSSWKKNSNNECFELDSNGITRLDAFKSKFHIAIENCSDNSYFSEKLIDCFVTKTIPIYWGAPNINKFFNEKGIIQLDKFNNIKEIINYIESLNLENLNKYIEDNYLRSTKYRNRNERLSQLLTNLINKNMVIYEKF